MLHVSESVGHAHTLVVYTAADEIPKATLSLAGETFRDPSTGVLALPCDLIEHEITEGAVTAALEGLLHPSCQGEDADVVPSTVGNIREDAHAITIR